jgi:hypothetical protein
MHLANKQHYLIKLVSDLRQVSGFLLVFLILPSIKLTATHIIEIFLLNVVLNTHNLNPDTQKIHISRLILSIITQKYTNNKSKKRIKKNPQHYQVEQHINDNINVFEKEWSGRTI